MNLNLRRYDCNAPALCLGILQPRKIEFVPVSAPTGPPLNLSTTTTSRNVMISWDTIECIERNGIITGYIVEFQEEGGAMIPGEVVGQNFTVSGLTPATHYSFRVAGVNSNGTGPFTTATITSTDEDCKHAHANLVCSFARSLPYLNIHVHSSWSSICPHGSAHVHFNSAHLECPSRTQWSHYQL